MMYCICTSSQGFQEYMMINRPRKQASLSVVANWHKSPIFLHSRVYDFSIARPSVTVGRSARLILRQRRRWAMHWRSLRGSAELKLNFIGQEFGHLITQDLAFSSCQTIIFKPCSRWNFSSCHRPIVASGDEDRLCLPAFQPIPLIKLAVHPS